jgi:hypothetical protein
MDGLQERAEFGVSPSSGFSLCAWLPNGTLGLLWKRQGGEGNEGNRMKSRKRREDN